MRSPGFRPFLVLASLAALLVAPSTLRAQCAEVSGSGCPGAAALQCGGSTSIGQTLELTCLNNGRASQQVMLLGRCNPTPLVLGPPLTCVSGPCYLAVDVFPPVVTLNTAFQKVAVPIPSMPPLVGMTICAQCIEVVSSGPCLSLSAATSITIEP